MKIVGFCVVGPSEADRYLKATLNEFKRLCDDVMIACNNTDKQTEEMIDQFGFKWYRDDREWGKFQPNIKTRLLNEIAKLNPTHILALDSDETIDGVTRQDLEKLEKNFGNYFFVVNLWDAGYVPELSFWNVRFYKFDPERTAFTNKPVHCGLAPPYAYNLGVYVPFILKHYGMQNKADRAKKVLRYKKYDPNAVYKWRGFYDSLASETAGTPLDIVKLQQEVDADVKKMGLQTRKTHKIENMKYFYIKRIKDGKIMDIPEKDVTRTMATKQFELIGEAVVTSTQEMPVQEAPADTGALCVLCGKIFKNEQGLKLHKIRSHS